MREIKIGFSSSKKVFPVFCWAIMLIERTNFSHVYVRSATRFDEDLIYQASGVQVNFTTGHTFARKNKVIREFSFKVSDPAFDNYMRFAMKHEGAPYSSLQIVGMFIAKVFGLKRNPLTNSSRSYVCSELVSQLLFELGEFQIERAKLNLLGPKEVYEMCEHYYKINNILMENSYGNSKS